MPHDRLRRFAAARGWTSADLASRIGVSPSAAWRYLHGERVPGLGPALAIERVTDGAVRASDWQPRARRRAAA